MCFRGLQRVSFWEKSLKGGPRGTLWGARQEEENPQGSGGRQIPLLFKESIEPNQFPSEQFSIWSVWISLVSPSTTCPRRLLTERLQGFLRVALDSHLLSPRQGRKVLSTLLSANFVSGLCLACHVIESSNMVVEFLRCSSPQELGFTAWLALAHLSLSNPKKWILLSPFYR